MRLGGEKVDAMRCRVRMKIRNA